MVFVVFRRFVRRLIEKGMLSGCYNNQEKKKRTDYLKSVSRFHPDSIKVIGDQDRFP